MNFLYCKADCLSRVNYPSASLFGNFLTEPFSAVSILLHSHPAWYTTLTVRHFSFESFAVSQICCAAVTFRMCIDTLRIMKDVLAVGSPLWLCKCDVKNQLGPPQSNCGTDFRVFSCALDVSHVSNGGHITASPVLMRGFRLQGYGKPIGAPVRGPLAPADGF